MSNVTRFPVSSAHDPDELWKALLLYSATGSPKPLLANAITAFRHSPEFKGTLAFDEFRQETYVISPPPWGSTVGWTPRGWTALDDLHAAEWLHHQGVGIRPDVVAQAIEVAAHERSFHPVRDYLNRIVWDGQPRVDKWLSYYCGAEHTPYSSAAGQCFLISAVARVMDPGCKADSMLIFEGKQSAGKSGVAERLAGSFFGELSEDFGNKDAALQLQGKWIIEVAELDSMSRVESNRAKAFVTRQVDRFRPPYGRRTINCPRQCVFIGTTNRNTYFKDETGNRRYWPVKLLSIDWAALEADRDQLWAEAVHLFKANTPWWFTDDEIIEEAKEEQRARYTADAWTSLIEDYVALRNEVTMSELLAHAIGLEQKLWDDRHTQRIGRIMSDIGWEYKPKRVGPRSANKREPRYRRV